MRQKIPPRPQFDHMLGALGQQQRLQSRLAYKQDFWSLVEHIYY